MTDTTPTPATTAEFDAGMARYAETQTERYAQTTAGIAKRLRDIADEVERESAVREGTFDNDGKPDFMWSAQQIVHTVMWGVANLSLDGLVSAARDAHNAVRGRVK